MNSFQKLMEWGKIPNPLSLLEIKYKENPNFSTLGFKYPTFRDHPLHTAHLWLMGKRKDDEAEGLWRIHDGLYDLSGFVDQHPGGKDWLTLTKGVDITEAFESHHISTTPSQLLNQFYVREAAKPRNSPFTFKDNGFYRVLKRRIGEELKNVPDFPATRSKIITDTLLLFYISLSVLSVIYASFSLGVLAGISLSCMSIAAHNFFHQRDNFRMYYFDFTMMSSRDWRVTHALSHHGYTNTINDIEISSIEPFLQYLPQEKHFIFRYLSWLYSPVFYVFIFFGSYVRGLIQHGITKSLPPPTYLLPFVVPIVMFVSTLEPILYIAGMYAFILAAGSLHFGIVGVNAAHHHPNIFHDGDTPRPKEELDWGIYQLDAVMDRRDINGSHFLVLTNFGDHGLHHLFPTVDHGKLEHLYPVFLKTCEEFGVRFKLTSQLKLIQGQYRQLAKVEPKQEPPPTFTKPSDIDSSAINDNPS